MRDRGVHGADAESSKKRRALSYCLRLICGSRVSQSRDCGIGCSGIAGLEGGFLESGGLVIGGSLGIAGISTSFVFGLSVGCIVGEQLA